MSSRLEILQARMREENERKAATITKPKPVRAAKRVKSVAQEAEPAVFDPKPSLMECIAGLKQDEASNKKTVAGIVALVAIDLWMRTPHRFEMSSAMQDNLTWLTAAPFSENINIERVFSTALTLADSVEIRSNGEEGSGIRAVREAQKLLLERKLGRA